MSMIHYKFASARGWKQIYFDGARISVLSVKHEIIKQAGLNKDNEKFDLILENAQTEERYLNDQNMIQKNTSLSVRRVPSQRVWDIKLTAPAEDKAPEQASEEQLKMKEIMSKSKSGLNPQLQRRRMHDPNAKPPPGYICHRCGKSDHYIKYCTRVGPKYAYLNDPKPEGEADNDTRRKAKEPNESEFDRVLQRASYQVESSTQGGNGKRAESKNSRFICPICNDYLRDATVSTCCFTNFCQECIHSELLADDGEGVCPQCKSEADESMLKPNPKLDEQVLEFLTTAGVERAAAPVPEQDAPSSADAVEKTEKTENESTPAPPTSTAAAPTPPTAAPQSLPVQPGAPPPRPQWNAAHYPPHAMQYPPRPYGQPQPGRGWARPPWGRAPGRGWGPQHRWQGPPRGPGWGRGPPAQHWQGAPRPPPQNGTSQQPGRGRPNGSPQDGRDSSREQATGARDDDKTSRSSSRQGRQGDSPDRGRQGQTGRPEDSARGRRGSDADLPRDSSRERFQRDEMDGRRSPPRDTRRERSPDRYRRDRSRDRSQDRNRNRSQDRRPQDRKHRDRSRERSQGRSRGRARSRSRDRQRARRDSRERQRSRRRDDSRDRSRRRTSRSKQRSSERRVKRASSRGDRGGDSRGSRRRMSPVAEEPDRKKPKGKGSKGKGPKGKGPKGNTDDDIMSNLKISVRDDDKDGPSKSRKRRLVVKPRDPGAAKRSRSEKDESASGRGPRSDRGGRRRITLKRRK